MIFSPHGQNCDYMNRFLKYGDTDNSHKAFVKKPRVISKGSAGEDLQQIQHWMSSLSRRLTLKRNLSLRTLKHLTVVSCTLY